MSSGALQNRRSALPSSAAAATRALMTALVAGIFLVACGDEPGIREEDGEWLVTEEHLLVPVGLYRGFGGSG